VELKVLNWRQAVQVKTKLLLIVMSLCAPLFFSAAIRAQPIQISDDAAVLRLFLPKMGPQQRPLNLLSRSPLLVNGLKAGVVVVYDDPTTARPADYFELTTMTATLLLWAGLIDSAFKEWLWIAGWLKRKTTSRESS
jgi:hypothetical protein